MAIIQIPIDSTNMSFKLRTDLEDTTYVFELYWNDRLSKWHINIMDADENPLLMGAPLNINMDILYRFQIPGLPPGRLMLYDASEGNVEATRTSLGDDALLLYEEAA